MREFLVQQFGHFELEDVYPGKELKCALFIFCAWAIPAFSFVLWAEHYYPTVEFFQSAITEGIGPNLWNALGAFGLFMFGLSIIFLNFNFPALVAQQILSNTYAIGCLTFGLLLGQWWLLLFDESIVWWHRGLFGVTSSFLIVIVFVYNLSVWYMHWLIRQNNNDKSLFLNKLEQMHFFWRVAIGFLITLLITAIFLSES